jgi:PAS domain S-box-containing protein
MVKGNRDGEVLELREALKNVRAKLDHAQQQLEEANSTLHAIQDGSVDAVVAVDKETGESRVLNLRSAEHPYRVFVEAVSEGALTVNRDGIAIFCNKYFAEMLKTIPGRVLGRSIREFVPSHESRAVDLILEIGGTSKLQQEIALLRMDGSLLQVQLSVSPVKTEDLDGICILATDLSERHRTQAALHRAMERARLVEDLKRALELRDEFLSIASHELKTPITSLLLQLQITQKSLDAFASQEVYGRFKHAVEVSIRQVRRLITLVEDLLDVSQIESGHLKLHSEETNLSQLISEVMAHFHQDCSYAHCIQNLQAGIVGLWDPIRLEQVLTNLLSNAFKYGGGRPIEVKLERSGDFAILTIQDHGLGISEEAQARVFGKFERAVRASNISGFGVGLYVTKQIVESHGGTIRLHSQRGTGTTFRVELPLRPLIKRTPERAA